MTRIVLTNRTRQSTEYDVTDLLASAAAIVVVWSWERDPLPEYVAVQLHRGVPDPPGTAPTSVRVTL